MEPVGRRPGELNSRLGFTELLPRFTAAGVCLLVLDDLDALSGLASIERLCTSSPRFSISFAQKLSDIGASASLERGSSEMNESLGLLPIISNTSLWFKNVVLVSSRECVESQISFC